MGRLIDEDKLKADLEKAISKNEDMDCLDFLRIASVIDKQPTAYDPEKVVKQLEEVEKIMTSPVNKDCFGEECRASDCTVCLTNKAIEIVKGGGVNGN